MLDNSDFAMKLDLQVMALNTECRNISETKAYIVKIDFKKQEYHEKTGKNIDDETLVRVLWEGMDEKSKDDAEAHDLDSLDTDYKTLCKFVERRAQRKLVRQNIKKSGGKKHDGGDPMQIGLVKPEEPREPDDRSGDGDSDEGDDDLNAVRKGRGRGKGPGNGQAGTGLLWMQGAWAPQIDLHLQAGKQRSLLVLRRDGTQQEQLPHTPQSTTTTRRQQNQPQR